MMMLITVTVEGSFYEVLLAVKLQSLLWYISWEVSYIADSNILDVLSWGV